MTSLEIVKEQLAELIRLRKERDRILKKYNKEPHIIGVDVDFESTTEVKHIRKTIAKEMQNITDIEGLKELIKIYPYIVLYMSKNIGNKESIELWGIAMKLEPCLWGFVLGR